MDTHNAVFDESFGCILEVLAGFWAAFTTVPSLMAREPEATALPSSSASPAEAGYVTESGRDHPCIKKLLVVLH